MRSYYGGSSDVIQAIDFQAVEGLRSDFLRAALSSAPMITVQPVRNEPNEMWQEDIAKMTYVKDGHAPLRAINTFMLENYFYRRLLSAVGYFDEKTRRAGERKREEESEGNGGKRKREEGREPHLNKKRKIGGGGMPGGGDPGAGKDPFAPNKERALDEHVAKAVETMLGPLLSTVRKRGKEATRSSISLSRSNFDALLLFSLWGNRAGKR